ncbi:hypothetical protein D1831_00935 [Lactiplantibacillus garii]|uniref:Uncharacterized protein n=1 Tax=Lactiplantibacillus garii TaxID=2306423 RepID=A0A426DAQ5_9LACO|nr:hypothetical protein [Lactiplantibacillus garii]RRK11670.1 hypothetical protein D1831_00935 [Lactiplantibacillus garii]
MNNDAQLSITQLNESLQQKAVEDFAKFYIPLFDVNNLELMSNYDVANYMTDINEHLTYGRYLTKQQRLADSVSFSFADYIGLISNLDQKYFESGNPAVAWNEWYATHFLQIANS